MGDDNQNKNGKLILLACLLIVIGIVLALKLRSSSKQQGTKSENLPTEQLSAEQLYQKNCAQCHRADLAGDLGPNLIDDFWISGNTFDALKRSIAEGNPDRGMPAYKANLSVEQIESIAKLIVENQGKQVANPKAPQGFGGKFQR